MASIIILLAGLGGLAALAGWFWLDMIASQPGPHDSNRIVLIEPGDGDFAIMHRLEKAGVLYHPLHYRLVSWRARGHYVPKIGEYDLAPRASLNEIVSQFHQGRTLQRRLTIPEGWQTSQIVDLLNKIEGLKGQIVTLPPEGSLFPDTYFYEHGMERQVILDRMQAAGEAELALAWAGRAPDLPLDDAGDLLKLASVIEAETGRAEERGLVASVFVNRLRSGMRLQSDPTVIYGLRGSWTAGRQLQKEDLQKDHRWNTYRQAGLPDTAIGNPGRAALAAAANPATTDYLYFVADGMGGHLFAKTLDGHNRNVQKYRQQLKAQK